MAKGWRVWRVENQRGEGPHQVDLPPGTFDLDRVDYQVDPETDFPQHQHLLNSPDYVFGFPSREHAAAWFGKKGLAALGKLGYNLRPLDADDVVYSSSGRQLMFRRSAVKKSETRRRVALVIAVRDGLVLFGKRRDTGRWTLPGGHLEEGEDPADGARRELKEEADLEPEGDLQLIDERQLGEVKLWTYRCQVSGAPTGKRDPDKEVELWAFFDVSKGIPKSISGELQGPRDPDKNVAADVLGLEKMARKPKKPAPPPPEELPWWRQPGAGVDTAAKLKVMAPIGDREWHPKERIESTTPVTVVNSGVPEQMHLIHTSSENIVGGRKNGRILLSFNPEATQTVGGLYHYEEAGKKHLQSAYLDPDFRGGHVMPMLIAAAKKLGIHTAVGPFSPAGEKLAQRYGFRIKKTEEELVKAPYDDYQAEKVWRNRWPYGGGYQYELKSELPLTKQEADEVDRLLLHPNPAERRLALKLAGVREHHLVRALDQDDPEVHELALRHPALGPAALLQLMQRPNREALQARLLNHPKFGRQHLVALYHTHKDRPFKEKRDILHGIAQHPLLDAGLIEQMVDDGNGDGVLENLNAPPHVLQKVIEAHLADPQDPDARRRARRALRHPAAPPELVERALREAPHMEVRVAAAQNPNLPTQAALDILKRGQLPNHDHEGILRAALVQHPQAQPEHLAEARRDRSALVRSFAQAAQQPVRKYEAVLGDWLAGLAKATRPQDYAGVVRASDPAGRALVDHAPDLTAHPPEHQHDVQAYRHHVLDSPEPVARKTRTKEERSTGITPKLVYELPAHHQTHAGVRFLVKPYHERVPKHLQKWGRHPHQGWAEMTSQALFHAAGIGHLHQNVHVAEHRMGSDPPVEPALVVRMDSGFRHAKEFPRYSHDAPESTKQDARKVAVMDFLANNLDRHDENYLLSERSDPATGERQQLAIDHGRNFQYINTHEHKWTPRRKQPTQLDDSLRPYVDGHLHAALRNVIPWAPRHDHNAQDKQVEDWEPTIAWWEQHAQAIRGTMTKRLEQIRDPDVRQHIARNFEARAKYLDDFAKWGLANFGTDWYETPVSLYRPGETEE